MLCPPRMNWSAIVKVATACLCVPTLMWAQERDAVRATFAPRGASSAAGDRVIVKYRPNISPVMRSAMHASLGAEPIRRLRLIDADVLRVPAGGNLQQVVRAYAGRAEVAYAEPDYLQYPVDALPATTPSDPQFSNQWALNNTGQSGGTPDADIDAPEAWDVTTGAPSMVIGLIDTGADLSHGDLAANAWVNPGETPGNGMDDDDNGYVDDINGWDFFHDDNTVYDAGDGDQHGTHTAGTIAAVGSNGVGVTGVAWNAKIMIIKFLGPDGGYTSDAILGIEYAIASGARLTSNSWGGGGFSQALRDAIAASGAQGMLFVAAAGNGGDDGVGDDNDLIPSYPANYDVPNIIAVAATTRTDARSSFSNFGATSVDLGAPGSSILSTYPGNQYATYNGTSMATPHVAGVAALVHAQFPGITHLQVKDRILASGDPLAALAGITVSGRRLNAANALETDAAAPAAVTDLAVVPDVAGTGPLSRTSLRLEWTAPGDDGAVGTATSYDLRYSTAALDGTSYESAVEVVGEPAPATSGNRQSFTIVGLQGSMVYYFALTTIDNVGNRSSLSNVIAGRTESVRVIFADNAETSASDLLWTAQSPWARTAEDASPDAGSHPTSGSYSWTDSPGVTYTNNLNASLTSIPFSLADARNTTLAFDHRYSTEAGYDYALVEISTNGGGTWTLLASYDGTQSWTSVALDLGPYEGAANVRVRFRLTTDYLVTYDGWHIDDVRVLADPLATIALRDTVATLGDTISVGIEVENATPLSGVDYRLSWSDTLNFGVYQGTALASRATGFTLNVAHDSAGRTVTAILVDPGGASIAAGDGPVAVQRMYLPGPPAVSSLPVSSVVVVDPDDPTLGLPDIHVPVDFTFSEAILVDTLGNPVDATIRGGRLRIRLPNADVDFSGTVDVVDVTHMIDYFLDRRTFGALQFLLADSYHNDVIDVVDVVRGVNIVLGRPIGRSAMLANAGSGRAEDALLFYMRPGQLAQGLSQTTTWGLVAELPPGITGIQLRLQYDTALVDVAEVRSTLASRDHDVVARQRPGLVDVMVFSPTNRDLSAGEHALAVVDFKALRLNDAGAPTRFVELVEAVGVSTDGARLSPTFALDRAANELLGVPSLTELQRRLLDDQGNRDGVYNLGDLLALHDRLQPVAAPLAVPPARRKEGGPR